MAHGWADSVWFLQRRSARGARDCGEWLCSTRENAAALVTSQNLDSDTVLDRFISSKNKILAGMLLHVTRHVETECRASVFEKLYQSPGCIRADRKDGGDYPHYGTDAVFVE
eukprot:gene33963-43907_t